MRIIDAQKITDAVKKLCMEANYHLPCDVKSCINKSIETEKSENGKDILEKIKENYEIADDKNVPICQDTGMAVFFIEIGTDLHIDGNITKAVNLGVKAGYEEGYLRKSIVKDPLFRENTGDNTPAVIHYDFAEGDKIKITIAPKGFGSENMSAIKMFSPSAGVEGIKKFVLETVDKAGSNPCPPIVVGIGIGGNFESCATLAKKALTRNLDVRHENPYYADLEKQLLDSINKLGIGPQGFGGTTTALGVNIETAPTHIAGMPCAVNISCHVTRKKTITI